jgi:hypothetical protein
VRKHNLTFVPDGPFERELLKVIGFAWETGPFRYRSLQRIG